MKNLLVKNEKNILFTKTPISQKPQPPPAPPPTSLQLAIKSNPKKSFETYAGLILTRNAQIKCLLKEVLYNSTAQAILKIFFTRHKVIKIIWALCLALTCSTCAPLLLRNFLSYFSYDVITTSRTIFETPTLFPKV